MTPVRRNRWRFSGRPGADRELDVDSGRRLCLARESAEPRLCEWGFDERAFTEAREWTLGGDYDAVAIPLGTLESAEGGHWPLVLSALERERPCLVVLALRPQVVAPIVLRLPDPVDALELPATEPQIRAFASRVAAEAANARSGAGADSARSGA